MFFNITYFLLHLGKAQIGFAMSADQVTHRVNLSFLKEISEGSNDLMRDLISMFINQVPTFSEQMDAYLKNEDYCTLAKLAHKIKNSVAMMGIEELTNDMKKLETLCNTKPNFKEIETMVNRFKSISAEASDELRIILETL